MPRVTEPLREEHAELRPHIESLKTAADSVSEDHPEALKARVDEAYEFLRGHLIPHAMAEERALYPVVARVMGAEPATRTMSRDHVEVGKLTEQLNELRGRLTGGTPSEATKNELRRVLYGLYTLVAVHFTKEEEVYLPLLDEKLDAAAARAMFEAMESAAAAEKHKLAGHG
jgi:iron-sulfur cluster repair protein YtfE (RIC family)